MLAVVLSVWVALPASAVHAAAPGEAPPSAQRRHVLQQMLADPGNVDLALAYAALAAREGDAEGAISTLERLLIFSPTLARLNFQLGMLYDQLGSFDAAAAYFKAAADAPDATPAIRAEVAGFLTTPRQQTAARQALGTLMFGIRYQTNANGGADSASVDLNGVDFLLSSAARADPDSNAFAAATYHFSTGMPTPGDRFDIDLSGYGSLYGKHDELDTAAGEIDFGPNFDLDRLSIPHARLGIYGLAGGVGLKGVPYLYTAGLGSVLTDQFDQQTQGRVRLELRNNLFLNSPDRPDVADMSGPRLRLTGDVRRQLTKGIVLYGTFYGERVGAVTGLNADWEFGGSAGTVLSFNSPVAPLPGTWALDLSAGALQRQYDASDPSISADRRVDHEAFAQAALTVPVTQGWSAVTTVGYRRAVSNYGLYSYDNASVSLAVTRGF